MSENIMIDATPIDFDEVATRECVNGCCEIDWDDEGEMNNGIENDKP